MRINSITSVAAIKKIIAFLFEFLPLRFPSAFAESRSVSETL